MPVSFIVQTMSNTGVQRKANVTQGWGTLQCLKGKIIPRKEGKSEYGVCNPTWINFFSSSFVTVT